eukprot:364585-Chlamydomonas_euryale.AAC.23
MCVRVGEEGDKGNNSVRKETRVGYPRPCDTRFRPPPDSFSCAEVPVTGGSDRGAAAMAAARRAAAQPVATGEARAQARRNGIEGPTGAKGEQGRRRREG